MKKLGFLFPFIILLLSCGEEPSSALTISLEPQAISINKGQQAALTIQIETRDVDVFAVSMRIDYDSSIVSFNDSNGFSKGTFLGSAVILFVEVEASIIHLTITLMQGQDEVGGSGNLGVLTFIGRSLGISDVEIVTSELYFYNADGNELTIRDLEVEAAMITVQ